MNLYIVKRDDRAVDFEQCAGMVVAASSEDEALRLHPMVLDSSHPDNAERHLAESAENFEDGTLYGWPSQDRFHELTITLIGTTHLTVPQVLLHDYKGG
ncbi:hypothetical protein FDJ23_gp201 [Erwinia phage vB_EamM_Desertfox]|uniref:Uncharacterized protein n=1 Tax=Erwinia phage vB_EamM_Desertfox TaxID=2060127 RepID=A0A2H5BJ25_9CAUD|nr:hypothetical protein FDJ23_gp201 [Erwinia phage vB_EamM_Desertfox]AUG86308.1 hypothetical protein DESERTFOX_201 [Erwinia phage vB_EamM_Desertfox]